MRRIAFVGLVVVLLTAGGLAAWHYQPDFVRAFFTKLDAMVYKKGTFKGELEVRFFSSTSGDGHPVEFILLLKPFGYTDASGVDWNVPEGFISDGASILDGSGRSWGGPSPVPTGMQL